MLALPATAGVGQILGAEGRNLVIGRAASLRRWAAARLGAGRPPKPGRRPPTDLRSVASAVAYEATTSAFHQRLVFERLMARYVPASVRRDLKPPAYLHLDLQERFPRVTVRGAGAEAALFGPFRDRRAAGRARDALHKRFPLRPCDYVFEPDPALPLGLGCVYAQVRTCAAPCLARIAKADYRALAREAAGFLAQPPARPEEAAAWLPAWVAARSATAVVVERGREGLELYPVRAGAVLEEAMARAAGLEDLPAAVARLSWPLVPDRDDAAWLLAWLRAPRRSGAYLVTPPAPDPEVLADRISGVLGAA